MSKPHALQVIDNYFTKQAVGARSRFIARTLPTKQYGLDLSKQIVNLHQNEPNTEIAKQKAKKLVEKMVSRTLGDPTHNPNRFITKTPSRQFIDKLQARTGGLYGTSINEPQQQLFYSHNSPITPEQFQELQAIESMRKSHLTNLWKARKDPSVIAPAALAAVLGITPEQIRQQLMQEVRGLREQRREFLPDNAAVQQQRRLQALDRKVKEQWLAKADQLALSGRHSGQAGIMSMTGVPILHENQPVRAFRGLSNPAIHNRLLTQIGTKPKQPIWWSAYPDVAQMYATGQSGMQVPNSPHYVLSALVKNLQQQGPHSLTFHPHTAVDTRALPIEQLPPTRTGVTQFSDRPYYESVFTQGPIRTIPQIADRLYKQLPSGIGWQQVMNRPTSS